MGSEYIVWVEDIQTKKVLEYHSGKDFSFQDSPTYKYCHDTSVEIFISHYKANPLWWCPKKEQWIQCNWTCEFPKEIQMQILCGAL